MGFGLPCIGTTAGAAGEVIREGETGFLVPPEDPAALSMTLQRLASDPGLLLRMSLAARQAYLAQPTWAQSGEKIRGFLQTLVAGWRLHGI
jgi:glycosyltransferase involved in cell wall biosynthesis